MSIPRNGTAARRLSIAVGLAVTVGLTPAWTGTAQAAGIDTTDRQAVTDAYNEVYLPAHSTPRVWENGSVDGCVPGTFGAAGQQATLDTVNYYRAFAGLNPVTFDAALSAKAQQAALVMRANNALSHFPPETWRCWTPDGSEAAGRSNLYLSWGSHAVGASAVDAYMVDSGVHNTAVGHRRWIMNPATTTMGSGSVADRSGGANALWVVGGGAPAGSYPNPDWVGWPTAGYFPTQHEPSGRWSFSASARDYLGERVDFSQARVSVRDKNGLSLALTTHQPNNGYGADTIVWNFTDRIPAVTGGAVDTYTVTVSNIGMPGGGTTSHSYAVRLFDPTSDARTILSVGESLTPGQSKQVGGFTLINQTDGNVVLYDGNRRPVWQTNTMNNGGTLTLQADGNLVLRHASGTPTWNSGTNGRGAAALTLNPTGELRLLRADATVVQDVRNLPGAPGGISRGGRLDAGRLIGSQNTRFRLVMQTDGNLVSYGPRGAMWSTGTRGAGNYATVQADGNFAVHSAAGRPLWNSRTGGTPASRVLIQDDGNVVLYDNGNTAYWNAGVQG